MHKVPRSRVAGGEFSHPHHCDRVSCLGKVRLPVTLDSCISVLPPSFAPLPLPAVKIVSCAAVGKEVPLCIVTCVS